MMMYRHRHNGHNDNRVNEQHVPESQHTIFVRGLPGDMSTNVVKEFFDENIGPCSFDFIKVSQDRSKLFVAVRFESKSAARDALDKYKDNEILGYPVEITFFRDIRRYIAHIQKQGGPPVNNNLGGRVFRNEFRNNTYIRKRFIPRRRTRSHSRSASRSNSRSGTPRSRSRSPPSRSPSCSRSRSTQRSSVLSTHKADEVDDIKTEIREKSVSPPPKKIKKTKKDKKKKKKHTPTPSPSPRSRRSESDMDTSDGETIQAQRTPIKKTKEVDRPASKDVSSALSTPVRTMVSPLMMQPSVLLKNSSITVDLDSNKVPQQKVRHSPMEMKPPAALQNGTSSKHTFASFNQENGKRFKEDFKEVSSSTISSQLDVKPTSDLGGAMTNFVAIQRRILKDVRYKIETLDDDECGNFRLSALSTQKMTETLREEKIAKMSSDLRDKIEKKKMTLELSYRRDCETFGLMTRKLIAKDRGLEDRLRLALLEVMKDLETEAMKILDEYIDQIMFLSC